MAKDDLVRELAPLMDAAFALSRASQSAEIDRIAQRANLMVTAAAGLIRTKAQTRFGWFLMILSPFVVAVAIYILIDGKRLDSLIVLLSSLIPLIGGAWHLRQADVAAKRWVSELTWLESKSTWISD